MFRSFSTAARVHPSFLPHLRPTPRRSPFRWLKAAVALSIIGYASKSCFDYTREHRIARAIAEEQEYAERQKRNQMMMDMYGDRESLEDLERAIAEYEKK